MSTSTSISGAQTSASTQDNNEATQIWQYLQGWVAKNQSSIPGLQMWFEGTLNEPQPSTLAGVEAAIQNAFNGRIGGSDIYMFLNKALYANGNGVVPQYGNDAENVVSILRMELVNTAQFYGQPWDLQQPEETDADTEFESMAQWISQYPNSDTYLVGNSFLINLAYSGSDVNMHEYTSFWIAQNAQEFANSVPLETFKQVFTGYGYQFPSFFDLYYSLLKDVNNGTIPQDGISFANDLLNTLESDITSNPNANSQTIFLSMLFPTFSGGSSNLSFFVKYPGMSLASLQAIMGLMPTFSPPLSANYLTAYLQLGNYAKGLNPNSDDAKLINYFLGDFPPFISFPDPLDPSITCPLQLLQSDIYTAENPTPGPCGPWFGLHPDAATIALLNQIYNMPTPF